MFSQDVEAIADREGVIEAQVYGFVILRGKELKVQAAARSLDPEADADIPLSIDAKPIFWNRSGFERDLRDKASAGVDPAVMIAKGHFALEERELEPAAVFRSLLLGRGGLPTLEVIVAVEPPSPDISVVKESVAQEKPIDSGRELQRVIGIEAVKPHQRPEERRGPETDLLEPDPGLA